MDSGFLNRFSKLFLQEKLAFRKKALIFGFFLALSIILWFMIALNKDYTTDINYPIRFKNFPENKTLIGELPLNLRLRVSAHGYMLLSNRISSRYIPIMFNVSSFTLTRLPGQDSSFFYLETRFIQDYVAKQLNDEFKIISIKPDTLIFPFARVVSKKVPVFANINYSLDKQLILKDLPFLSPDSVVVSGPDYILDTLQIAPTETTDIGILSSTVEKNLKLKKIKHISYSNDNVKVLFTIEKFTEKTLNIPISVNNLPDSLKLQVFPRNIQLTCQVGLSNFDHLQTGMFEASVDYKEIVSGISRLQVNLTNQPNFIRAIKFKPKTVEFLIEK